MTAGLLVSCTTKNKLFKAKLLDNSAANLLKYKDYKTVYSKTLRAAKKLYYQQKFEANVKNPKKTWETLNEVMGKEKRSANVEKININGNISSDPSDMANHFNEFFSQIGIKKKKKSPTPFQANRRSLKITSIMVVKYRSSILPIPPLIM
jgi:hypothetical protein